MPNSASATSNQTHVNGVWVMTFADTGWATGVVRAQTAADRLNAIFSDATRDLDFITPSFQQPFNGGYCVVCPPVRYPGGPTYFNTVSGCTPNNQQLPYGSARNNLSPCATGSTLCLPEKMYHLDNTTDDRTTGQALATPVVLEDVALHNMERWQIALVFANNIRAALDPANKDALGRSPIAQLVAPGTITPTGQIYSGGYTWYGTDAQGLSQADPTNVCSSNVANGEIFHPLDLSLALSDSQYTQYANKWVQVCDPTSAICIAARVTDSSGPNGLPDLAYGGLAIPLGKPATIIIKTLP